MPSATLSVHIRAKSEDIFDLVHDYDRRLEWDSFLRDASLLKGATAAGVGITSRCVARWGASGAAMETRYITFSRPNVSAVRMTKGPWFMRLFAASIRHEEINDHEVRVEYRYSFKTRPAILAFVIEPIIQSFLRRETRQRLASLKGFLETDDGRSPAN